MTDTQDAGLVPALAVDGGAGATGRRPGRPRRDAEERYRWVAMGVVLVGSWLVVLDTTIVNVALPQIRDDLGAGTGIEWVVTAYLLAVVASQPATAWMADRYGRKHVFVGSLMLFTTASLLSAVSPSLSALVAFRVLQGLGGGAIMPVGMAIVFDVFPPDRRGQALALWGVASMAGPAIGPTLGGYLVTSVSWHWLFLVNVPIGMAGVVVGIRFLRETGHRDDRRLDVLGLILGAGGLTLTLLGVAQSTQWGWGSPATLTSITAGVVMLVAFVVHELRTPAPIVQLRMFKTSLFTISIVIIMCTAAAQFTRLVFIPLKLEGVRGFTALRVGVLLIPQAVASAIGMWVGGRLGDRIGPRIPVVTGCALMGSAGFLLGHLTTHTALPLLLVMLSMQGLGMGLAMAPATVVGLNAVRPELLTQAAAVRSLSSQIAGAIVVAALSTLVASRLGLGDGSLEHQQAAYNSAFLVIAGLMTFATVLAFRLPMRAYPRAAGPALALEH